MSPDAGSFSRDPSIRTKCRFAESRMHKSDATIWNNETIWNKVISDETCNYPWFSIDRGWLLCGSIRISSSPSSTSSRRCRMLWDAMGNPSVPSLCRWCFGWFVALIRGFHMGFHTGLAVPPRSQDLELKEKIEALAAEAGSCRILVSPSPIKGIAGIAIISASGARARNVQGLVPSLNSMEKDYRQRLILCLVVLPFWVSIGMVVLTDTNGMLPGTNNFR